MAQREYQRMVVPCFHSGTQHSAVYNGASISAIARSVFHRRNRFRRKKAQSTDISLSRARAVTVAKSILRRAFDAACAAAGLAILAPVFVMIALAIKLDDGGPVLYIHFRVGKNLRRFRFLKFRTMIQSSVAGSLVTAPNDARVTRVGRFLRRYKLDELPQLVNVLTGEMQLVGSRPQLPEHVELFHDEYNELLRFPPGITDLATLSFRDEERFFHAGSIEEQYVRKIMPIKLRLALKYSRTRSFRSDLEIIFRTVLGLGAPSAAWRDTTVDPSMPSLSEYFSRHVQ